MARDGVAPQAGPMQGSGRHGLLHGEKAAADAGERLIAAGHRSAAAPLVGNDSVAAWPFEASRKPRTARPAQKRLRRVLAPSPGFGAARLPGAEAANSTMPSDGYPPGALHRAQAPTRGDALLSVSAGVFQEILRMEGQA